jgi:prepilin peptidase CpaA
MDQPGIVQTLVVLAITASCTYTDCVKGKVYNLCTYPAATIGVCLSLFSPPPDLFQSITGGLAGLAIFGVLWNAGGVGAGDVKLIAAIGALKGVHFIFFASFYIVCAAALGGLVVIVWKGRLWITIKWVGLTLVSPFLLNRSAPTLAPEARSMIPFAPFVFIGTAYTLYLEYAFGQFFLF